MEVDDTLQLPSGWALTSFGAIFDIQGGSQPPKSSFISAHREGYVRLLQIRDFKTDQFAVFIPDGMKHRPKCDEHDLLVARYGASLGRICTGKAGAYNVALAKVLFNRQMLDPKWVKAFLESEWFQAPLRLVSRSAQNGFNKAELIPRPVPLPPLNEQRRIGAKLEVLFGRNHRAKESLVAVPALLERFRESVLAAAFRGDLTRDWREKNPDVEPASKLLERIRVERRRRWEEAELEGMRAKRKMPKDERWKEKYRTPSPGKLTTSAHLPRGWVWASLLELAFVESGQTPNGIEHALASEGEIPWFRVGDMNLTGNEHAMLAGASHLTRDQTLALGLRIRPVGTIIFPKRGGAIATNKKRLLSKPSCYDLNTMGIVPIEPVGNLLWWWLAQLDLAQIGDGSNIPQINHGDIEPLLVPVPPLEEQKIIVRRLEAAFVSQERIRSSAVVTARRIAQLDEALLAKAFRGELVPQDPADEPASVLLDRIKSEREKREEAESKTRTSRRASKVA
jgi:type I restriction enzyme S subunit